MPRTLITWDFEPTTNEFVRLEIDSATGRLISAQIATPAEAIQGLTQAYFKQDPTIERSRDSYRQGTEPLSQDAFADLVEIGLIRILRANHGNIPAFANDVRAAIQDTRVIQVLLNRGYLSPDVARLVWPDLEQRLQNFAPPEDSVPTGQAPRIDGTGTQGSIGSLYPTESTGNGTRRDQHDSEGQGAASSPQRAQRTGGDPLVLFSGQFYHQVTDLEVVGRGLHFAFTRTYLHQTIYKGPLGYSWDHSYNLWLREEQLRMPNGSLRNVVYRSTGQLREDPYFQIIGEPDGDLPPLNEQPDARFQTPPGFFDRLWKSDGRYILETVTGVRYHYNTDLYAEKITDLNGNEMTFEYSDGLLSTIRDPVGKEFTFRYDEMNRIAALHDVIGNRTIRFTYTDNGDLEEVDAWLQPDLVAGTDYRYLGPDQPFDLQHNLVEIISPRGESVLVNEYGTAPGTLDYNRVVRQRSADGEYRYEYDWVAETPVDPGIDPINVPERLARVYYPNDHYVEHWFNGQGNVVRRTEQIINAVGLPEELIAAYSYSEDGLLVREVGPDGGATEYRYQREAYAALHGGDASGASPAERLSFGNLLHHVVFPRPGFGEERCIVTKYTYYDTVGNRLKSVYGPYYAHRTDTELTPLDDQRILEVSREYDGDGNLKLMRFPALERPDGTVQLPTEYRWEYGEYGQLTDVIIGSIRTQYVYFEDHLRSGFIRERIEDADGIRRRTRFEMDNLGRMTRIIDPLGGVTELAWTTFDALRWVRAPEVAEGIPGPVTSYRYDRGRLMIESREEVQLLDGRPHADSPLVYTVRYDAYGRPREHWTGPAANLNARRMHTVFNAAGLIEREVDAAGVVLKHWYDERLLPSEVTRGWGTPAASTRRIRYNRSAEVVELIDGRGYSTRIFYDSFGRLLRTRDADGNAFVVNERDAAGRATQWQLFGPKPDGVEVIRWAEKQTRYDAAGRTIETIDHVFIPGEQDPDTLMHTRYFHDPLGRLESIVDQLGNTWSFRYDGLGRLLEARDPDENKTTIQYDDTRRTITRTRHEAGTDASGALVTELFRDTEVLDRRGLLVEARDEVGNTTRRGFDSRRLLVSIIDPSEKDFELEYNIFGQALTQWTILDGHVVRVKMEYDTVGRLKAIISPINGRTEYHYDALGRVDGIQRDSDGASFIYDEEDCVTLKRDTSGIAVGYTYTPGGLLEQILPDATAFIPLPQAPAYRPSNTPPSVFRYTPFGSIARASNDMATVSVTVNSLGLPVEERSAAGSISYGYDPCGRPARFAFPEGRTVDFDYSPGGRLVSIDQKRRGRRYPGDPEAPDEHSLAHIRRIGARPSAVKLSNNLSGTFEYDALGRSAEVEWRHSPDGDPDLRERLLYGSRGEQRVRQLQGRTRLTDYDGLARMVRVTEYEGLPLIDVNAIAPSNGVAPTPVVQEDIDRLIERTRMQALGRSETSSYTYGLDHNGNRLRTEERLGNGGAPASTTIYVPSRDDRYQTVGGTPLIYDGVGNILDDGLGNRYQYDALHRLTHVESPGGAISYTLDPLGRLLRRSTLNGIQEYVYANERLVEWRVEGKPAGQIVPLERPNQIAHLAAAGKDWTPLCDSMDSVYGWVSQDGVVSAQRNYDSFGSVLDGDAVRWPAPFGFAGYPYEAITGTYRLLARTYNPRLGRFTQLDSAGFVDGTNLYAYSRNAPGTLMDYWGFAAQDQNWRPAHIDPGAFLENYFKTALEATGIAIVVGVTATAAPITLPAIAIVGFIALDTAYEDSFRSRLGDAMRAGRTDAADVGLAALVALGDTTGVVTPILEVERGRTFFSERPLGSEESSEMLGGALGGAAGGLAGMGASRLAVTEARAVARNFPSGVESRASVGMASPRRASRRSAATPSFEVPTVNPGGPQGAEGVAATPGRQTNCLNTAYAMDQSLRGAMNPSLPSGEYHSQAVPRWFFGTEHERNMAHLYRSTGLEVEYRSFHGVHKGFFRTTPRDIVRRLRALPHGTRGIVVGSPLASPPGEPPSLGHAFNVVNDHGTVFFIDGQWETPLVSTSIEPMAEGLVSFELFLTHIGSR